MNWAFHFSKGLLAELIDMIFIFAIYSNLILSIYTRDTLPFLSFFPSYHLVLSKKKTPWHIMGISSGSLVILELLASANDWSTKLLTYKKSLILCSLVEWVVLALEIGEFHIWGNQQWCGYGSMTRGQMIARQYWIVLENWWKINEEKC